MENIENTLKNLIFKLQTGGRNPVDPVPVPPPNMGLPEPIEDIPENVENVENVENACLCCTFIYGILNFLSIWSVFGRD